MKYVVVHMHASCRERTAWMVDWGWPQMWLRRGRLLLSTFFIIIDLFITCALEFETIRVPASAYQSDRVLSVCSQRKPQVVLEESSHEAIAEMLLSQSASR